MEPTYNQYSENDQHIQEQQLSATNYYGFNYNYNYMNYYNPNEASYHYSSPNNTSINATLPSTTSSASSTSSYSLSNSFFNASLNTPTSPQPQYFNNYYDSLKSEQFNSPKSYSFNTQSAFISANYTPSITSSTSSVSHYQPITYSSTYTSTPYQSISNSKNQSLSNESIDLTTYNSSKSSKVQATVTATTSTKKSSKRPKVVKLDISQTNIGFGKVSNGFQSTTSLNTVTKSFQCSECPASFSIAAKLFMHQHKSHKNRSSTECPICFKKFNSPANALVHLRAHTQEKTYKCEECGLAFCDSSTLKKHIRTHTGEKPYECHLCSKSFAQSGNLKRHLAVHEKYDAIQGVSKKSESTENNSSVPSLESVSSSYSNEQDYANNISNQYYSNEYQYYYNEQSYSYNN